MLAQRGFEDSQNSYAWSMAWFKGKLYVGTGRSVMCVEHATNQFYFRLDNIYTTNPALNVHCPPDPYDLDLRAEIWRYTPQTGRWRMVYRSPANVPNPRKRGKFLARDIAFRGMKVLRDRRGRKALFVSGVTANEYVPENARSHPPRLLRTYDGEHYHDISRPLVVHRTGDYADRRPIGYRGLEVVGKQVFVVASTGLAGDGAVFRVKNPFARKARFSQVTPRGMHVFELQKFQGHLYLGTGSFDTGYGVYKALRRGTRYRFQPVVTNGAGLGGDMVSVVSMYPFRDRLYVGAVSWYSGLSEKLPETELIRIDRNDDWEVVAGAARSGPDGRLRSPISGLPSGFGNMFNAHFWRMVEQDGALYVGTLDWTWLLQDNEEWAGEWKWLVDLTISFDGGYDLWVSCDGVDWSAVTRNAFIGDPYEFGVRSLAAGSRGFYIGSANHAYGTRIWHDDLSPCRARTAASRADAALPPRHVLTDVQRDGTVISWEPSANAARYRIERSEYVDAALTLRAPETPPGEFPAEGALPRVAPTSAQAGGPTEVQLRMPFTTIGTTSRPYFVDRTRDSGTRYAYQIVAQTAAGATSTASNTQIVPDPRPPATFGQLADAAHTSGAVAAVARARQEGRGSVARLARLARSGVEDSVRQLARRLERRLRYHDLAGGPVQGG